MDIGDRIEGVIDKHAGKIGAGLAALAGIGGSWDSLLKVTYPDSVGNKNALERYLWLVQHGGITLIADQSGGYFSGLNYLKYKFTDPTCSWSGPFKISLAAYILSKLGIIPPRFNRPLENSSEAALIMSTLGALFLPGTTPDYPKSPSTLESPSINMIGGAF